MLADVLAVRNKRQPRSPSNSDSIQFDYRFWTELESLARKEREKALKSVKALSENPDKPGIILKGTLFDTELAQSEPVRSFDKDRFVELLVEAIPGIERHKIRECLVQAVIPGNPRNTYKVIDKK